MAQIHSQGPPLLLTGERYGGGRSSTRSWSRGVPMSLSVSYTYYWHNIPRFKVNATTHALALLYTLHVGNYAIIFLDRIFADNLIQPLSGNLKAQQDPPRTSVPLPIQLGDCAREARPMLGVPLCYSWRRRLPSPPESGWRLGTWAWEILVSRVKRFWTSTLWEK